MTELQCDISITDRFPVKMCLSAGKRGSRRPTQPHPGVCSNKPIPCLPRQRARRIDMPVKGHTVLTSYLECSVTRNALQLKMYLQMHASTLSDELKVLLS